MYVYIYIYILQKYFYVCVCFFVSLFVRVGEFTPPPRKSYAYAGNTVIFLCCRYIMVLRSSSGLHTELS